jgi:hypothetical protein
MKRFLLMLLIIQVVAYRACLSMACLSMERDQQPKKCAEEIKQQLCDQFMHVTRDRKIYRAARVRFFKEYLFECGFIDEAKQDAFVLLEMATRGMYAGLRYFHSRDGYMGQPGSALMWSPRNDLAKWKELKSHYDIFKLYDLENDIDMLCHDLSREDIDTSPRNINMLASKRLYQQLEEDLKEMQKRTNHRNVAP